MGGHSGNSGKCTNSRGENEGCAQREAGRAKAAEHSASGGGADPDDSGGRTDASQQFIRSGLLGLSLQVGVRLGDRKCLSAG